MIHREEQGKSPTVLRISALVLVRRPVLLLAPSLSSYEQSCTLETIKPPTVLGPQLRRLHGNLMASWAVSHGAAREREVGGD